VLRISSARENHASLSPAGRGSPHRVSVTASRLGIQARANRLTIATMKPFDPEPVSFLQVVSLAQNLEIAFEKEKR
jgi:hypothetical protein